MILLTVEEKRGGVQRKKSRGVLKKRCRQLCLGDKKISVMPTGSL